jgi:Secretion system C-terminal sorting domain
MIRIFLLCSLLLIGALDTQGQWNRVKVEGGSTKALAQTNNYLFTYNSTNLYRSPINSISWELLKSNELTDNLDFLRNELQLVNYHNELFLFNLNTAPTIVKTHDDGNTWNKIQLNPNHKIKSSFIYKDSLYITANSIYSNGKDSTIIYKYQTNTFLLKNKYNINYTVKSYNDTLVFINNHSNQWLISENFTSFRLYGVDLFRDKLSSIKKSGTRLYGVLNQNPRFLYYSDALGLWKNLLEISTGTAIRNYVIIDSILFIESSFQDITYLFKYDLTTKQLVQLSNSIGSFTNIIKLKNQFLISTDMGLFEFDLAGNFTTRLTGLVSNYSDVYEYKNRFYRYDYGSVKYSDDLGQNWQNLSPTFDLKILNYRMELENRTFIIQNLKLYLIKNKDLELEEVVLPDSNLRYVSFLGKDDQYLYVRFNNSNLNGLAYFKIDKNLVISPVKGLNPPLYLPMTCLFSENDTLFGFGLNPEFQYYSINSGDYWNPYPKNSLVDKNYYVNKVNKIAGVLFTEFEDLSKIGRPNIAAYRLKSKWTETSGYYDAYDFNDLYSEGNCAFIFDGLGNLVYSCDSFNTFTNTGIDFSSFANKSIHKLSIVNNTLVVSFHNYGIWTHPLNINTGIPNKVVESLSIYPNPSQSSITIRSNEIIKELRVFNLDGQLMMQLDNVKENTINIESLPQGLYVLSTKKGAARFVKL